eukprot:1394934-Amorphochlora_amoeboformis.AAC.1
MAGARVPPCGVMVALVRRHASKRAIRGYSQSIRLFLMGGNTKGIGIFRYFLHPTAKISFSSERVRRKRVKNKKKRRRGKRGRGTAKGRRNTEGREIGTSKTLFEYTNLTLYISRVEGESPGYLGLDLDFR